MKITVKIAGRAYEVEIDDLNTDPILATVEGETFEVAVFEDQNHAAPDAPRHPHPTPCTLSNKNPSSATDRVIVAPIPGVIVGIAVQAGACVTKGQEVCKLETMKMQNIIRAPSDGRIKAILVSAGETVKQKQPLMEYAEG